MSYSSCNRHAWVSYELRGILAESSESVQQRYFTYITRYAHDYCSAMYQNEKLLNLEERVLHVVSKRKGTGHAEK